MARTAVIVGAGIGGLAAGIALRQAGWNIRIVERAASPRELGFGLMVAPNAVDALRELGVADVVLARAFAPVRGEVRRPDGTVLKRADFPPPDAMGGPTVVALRPALHGALLEAVGADALVLGHAASGFTRAGDRVVLQLANGDSIEGHLLVGADGVHSVIRRALHPSEPPPRASGLVSVRGGVHGVVHHLRGLSGIYYVGRGIEAAIVRASDTGIYWFVAVPPRLLPPGLRDPHAIVRHLSPGFDETFRAIASATADLRVDDLVDRDPIASWGTGPVTLLGDAAHPVLPHTGQGAAQALVDAVALGRALPNGAPVEPALREYERVRREHTAALLQQGRRTARVMASTNPLLCYARDTAIRMVPVKPLVKVIARINRRAGTDVTARR